MGMSTHVVRYRPPDEQWQKMKSVWDACIVAEVVPPMEVAAFFDEAYPGDAPGKEVQITAAVQKWRDGDRDGFQVDVELLPDGVRYLRFYSAF